jgi:hypothetical protein
MPGGLASYCVASRPTPNFPGRICLMSGSESSAGTSAEISIVTGQCALAMMVRIPPSARRLPGVLRRTSKSQSFDSILQGPGGSCPGLVRAWIVATVRRKSPVTPAGVAPTTTLVFWLNSTRLSVVSTSLSARPIPPNNRTLDAMSMDAILRAISCLVGVGYGDWPTLAIVPPTSPQAQALARREISNGRTLYTHKRTSTQVLGAAPTRVRGGRALRRCTPRSRGGRRSSWRAPGNSARWPAWRT